MPLAHRWSLLFSFAESVNAFAMPCALAEAPPISSMSASVAALASSESAEDHRAQVSEVESSACRGRVAHRAMRR